MPDDSLLQAAVQAELSWEPSLNSAHIGVEAEDGVVTLTGHVETYREKSAAEDAASRVRGVKGVAEAIEVRLAFDAGRTDKDIALAALNRLVWDSEVPGDLVRVKVENGWVTLTGELERHHQMLAAGRDVGNLRGVMGVSNQITIKPAPVSADIQQEIRHAIHRSWFDPKTIIVNTSGGHIHLTGTVTSWNDRELASVTAWAAPGATSVQNDLAIV